MFGIGIVMTAVLTLLTPIAAYTNVWLLVVVRALEGFFEVCSNSIGGAVVCRELAISANKK